MINDRKIAKARKRRALKRIPERCIARLAGEKLRKPGQDRIDRINYLNTLARKAWWRKRPKNPMIYAEKETTLQGFIGREFKKCWNYPGACPGLLMTVTKMPDNRS